MDAELVRELSQEFLEAVPQVQVVVPGLDEGIRHGQHWRTLRPWARLGHLGHHELGQDRHSRR
eukprot:14971950-Alexandrium_andersonii.AAC.1